MLLFCEDAEHTTEEPLKEESKNLYIKFKNMAGGTHENVKGVQKMTSIRRLLQVWSSLYWVK